MEMHMATSGGAPSQDTEQRTFVPGYVSPVFTPLKTLVAEYLMERYQREETEPPHRVDFGGTFSVLTAFLAWEEKRRTPPSITTRGHDQDQIGNKVVALQQPVQWVTSGRQDP